MSNTSSPDGFVNKLCKNNTQLWIHEYLKARRTVYLVEGCVFVAALFLLIILVLGPWRCRSRNVVVQYAVRGAHMFYFPLLSYTMGPMKGVIKNELYSVWALFLLLFTGANSMSVQKLDENKQWLKLFVDSSLYLFYAGTIWGSTVTIPITHPSSLILKVLMNVLLPLRNAEMLWARQLASDPRWNGSPAVDRNMKYYELALSPCYNPRSMEGYNYLVFPLNVDLDLAARPSQDDIQRARSKLVTLEKIWCHGDGVLSMDNPAIHHLKDLCLSFALFRLTVRRYFGYACPESGLDKTRDLVLQGLLDEGCDRAFRVVEVELDFLYEFFFTKYAIIVYSIGVILSNAVSVTITTIIIYLGTYILTHLKRGGNSLTFEFVQTETRDITITKLILWSLAAFQLLQTLNIVVSNWAKVYLLCKYITKSSWQGNKYLDQLLLSVGKLSIFLQQHKMFGRWGNKMGKYSFMDSFNHPGHGLEKYKEFILMFQGGRKEGTSIPVPAEVKKAIAWTPKDSNGHISNGSRALGRYGMTELYSSCEINNEITLAHVIMTWHIATWHFEISESNRINTVQETNLLVATSLSKYRAYLVAFAPELVPGSPVQTQSMLDELINDARKALRGTSDIYKRLQELQNEGTQSLIFAESAILGMKLESMEEVTRWNLLADFWAELMLYIAPSDNVAGHIEHLAQGGEFVTHVWALLMHAGILERPASASAI